MYPMKLTAPLKDYLWGGEKLKTEYGKKSGLAKVAESWELSCHKDGESVITNGAQAGKTLRQYLQEAGRAVLGKNCDRFSDFPILIKLIDAKDNLSVQVHPDNAYAQRVEGEYGKTEMWYVVDCEPGARLLYGFKESICANELRERIENNTLLEVLNSVEVHKGDVFFIEAGTIHAIGSGILIAEIQQNSNTTYRVYDYGRIGVDGKPRPLHVDKAIDVIQRAPAPVSAVKAPVRFEGGERRELASCEYFNVEKISLDGKWNGRADEKSFHSLLCLDGAAELTGAGVTVSLQKGETVFLPAGLGDYIISGKGEMIMTTVPEKAYYIGIDLGGTNIVAGVVDRGGNILAKASEPTNCPRSAEEICKTMAQAARESVSRAGISMDEVVYVGIGSPGVVNHATGIVEYSNNLQFYDAPVRELMQNHLGKTVYMDNDANAAALGEVVAGSAKGAADAVVVTLGTGVGSGVVIGSKIYAGFNFAGGEFGHMVIQKGGRLCTCGRHGCMEAYTSATGLILTTREAMQAHPESKMWELCGGKLEDANGRTAFDAMRAGDAAGKAVVEEFADYLACGIANIVNALQPQILSIGGGVSKEGETLLAPVREKVLQESFSRYCKETTKIVAATLGNDAGLIGAAMLGLAEQGLLCT